MRNTLSLCLLGTIATLGPARAIAQPGPPTGAPQTDAPVSDAPRADVPPPNPAQANAPRDPPSSAPGAAATVPADAAASAPAPNNDEAAAQARRDIESAVSAQNRGDYDKAISFYRKAFRVIPHPMLLFNAAQSYRLSGQPSRALALLHRYLAVAPDGSQAPFARRLVERLELHAVEPIDDAGWDSPSQQKEAAPPPTPAVIESHENNAQVWMYTFIGTTAVAAAATGYYAYAQHKADVHLDRGRAGSAVVFDRGCSAKVRSVASFDRACTYQSRANAAFYTLIGASAASLGSLIMWMRERGASGRNEDYYRYHQVSVAPVVSPSGGGATVSLIW